MSQWYEEWFNTEEYLNVYRHRNEIDAQKLIDLILQNISLPENSNVLDMACGAGRHSISLAQKGFKVTAVDLSENLLAVARSTAKDFGLKIEFIRTDLRKFSSEKRFKLALNLFTSIGYFNDDKENNKIFEIVFFHLSAGGFFALDYLNKNFIEKNLIPQSEDEIENGKIIQKRSIEGNRVVKKITIQRNGSIKHYMESVRMFHINELLETLERTGFKKLKLFGDFYGNNFDIENSPRIILILQK